MDAIPALLIDASNQAYLRSWWRELTNERDSTVVPDLIVDRYVWDGAKALNRRIEYHWSTSTTDVTLVANTQEYALPSDCVRVGWVELGGTELVKGDVEQWRNRSLDWRNEAAGFPIEWAMYGDKIVFYPKPSAAAVAAAANPVIRYVSTPVTFSTDVLAQLADQDHVLAVYFGVATWSDAHPDSAVAAQRAEKFMARFEQEAEMVKGFYAQRGLAR